MILTADNKFSCNTDPSAIVEQRELITRLQRAGYGGLLAALADPSVYARRGEGRLVMTALARRLGVGPKKARQILASARAALG